MCHIDQAGYPPQLKEHPQRIISLVPSQTELLYDLGLDTEVVGITKFCVHPAEWFRTKSRIGGTKTVNITRVIELKPDLIIANKEENVKEQVDELGNIAHVYVSDISNLDEAFQMIEDVGLLVGREQKARQIVADITSRFDQLRARISQYSTTTGSSSYAHSSIPPGKHERTHNTAYLIWKEPYMVAGGRTFINDMMKICGLTNLFEHSTRYPEISVDKLVSLNCSLLLLSSEPYPFNRKNVAELQVRLPYAKILLVDGEMFSWYGSRLLKAPQYFSELLEEVRC